jgi:ribosome biogenesis GTPase
LLAILELKEIEPALAFTKIDQKTLESFSDIYVCAGFKTFFIDNTTGEGTEELSEYIDGKTSAFIGNSGVGKSSLLNVILPNLRAATAVTSKKLGRGRHTTREVELYRYNQGYVADTPGFSTVDASRYGDFTSEDLIYGFREFVPYIMKCPYKGCTHTGESECSVKAAVTKGEISESRYKSYNMIYSDIKKSENIY